MRIGCVILAAGLARRFGRDKLSEEIGGKTMLRRTAEIHASVDYEVRVLVTRPGGAGQAADGMFDEIAVNPEPEKGISGSVRTGIRALFLSAASKGKILDGVLFGVSDQPGLTRETVERLTDAFSLYPDRIIAPAGPDGRRGNPVIFPVSLIPELMELTGDRGGGAVIDRHPELLYTVPAEAEELKDVDTPEDAAEACPR